MAELPPSPSDAPAASRRGAEAWAVGELLRALAEHLALRFGACTVEGELSGFQRAASGHCYFSLKDAHGSAALIRCAMFRRAAVLVDFAPRDGQRVQVRGRIAVYEPRGELQFVVEAMRPAGAGTLYERFLRLKAQLEGEGLFDAARKRPLPAFPRRVGVVTSLQAAALHDVATAFARRSPHVEVIVYPTPVQGADAPAQIVAALALAAARNEVDLLLLCRGGGSLEDLWAFNDERVVRAVAASPLPLVCGVGHETDVSLADFAADLRAPTPTAAAELAAPSTTACAAALLALAMAMQQRVERALDQRRQRLDRAALRLARPTDALQRQRHALALLRLRLLGAGERRRRGDTERVVRAAADARRAVAAALGTERQRLASLAVRLDAVDPQRVLTRGYAWLADAAGAPIASVHGIKRRQKIVARLADGSIAATVQAVEAGPATLGESAERGGGGSAVGP